MERDGAVDAVLTAETLIEQFVRLGPQLKSMLPVDVGRAVEQAQHLYPEIWAHLDRARKELGKTGVELEQARGIASLAVYDELRARQPAALMGVDINIREPNPMVEAALWTTAIMGVGVVAQVAMEATAGFGTNVGAKQATANTSGIADAREAARILRDAMPGVDWKARRAENERAAAALGHSLNASRSRQLLIGMALVAALIAVVFGISKLLAKPEPKKADAAETSSEIIGQLRVKLAMEPCNAPAAELLVKKLRMRGNTGEAREFGKGFLVRCGDN